MTRHCHRCGWEWAQRDQPGRSETCLQCGADLRVCLNCVSFDAQVAQQCRDRRADPVAEKDRGNFCEYFELARRPFALNRPESSREAAARQQLRRLFGD